MKRSARFFLFLMIFAAQTVPQNVAAQARRPRLEQGISLYRAGYWADAALELRLSQMEAANPGQLAESLYWLCLAEFALGEHEAALRDIGELQRIAPAGLRIDTMLYYKGRSLYHVNRHEEALAVFRLHEALLERSRINSPQARAQKATLAYWIGECLYSLGQQDQAAELFAKVVNAKPRIEKYEAASYRLAMLRQNKLQADILGTLDWSYSEYLRLEEEYREREAAFNETIAAYREQTDTALGDAAYKAELEERVAEYRRLLADAEKRIRVLEARLEEAEKAAQTIPAPGPVPAPVLVPAPGPASAPALVPGPSQEDAVRRIRELKAEAEKLRESLMP
jgi:tetratricopeptide (TPR) repeat protein